MFLGASTASESPLNNMGGRRGEGRRGRTWGDWPGCISQMAMEKFIDDDDLAFNSADDDDDDDDDDDADDDDDDDDADVYAFIDDSHSL